MNPRVQEVKCKDGKYLILTFENGEKKMFDVSPYLNYPVFEVLKDTSFFNTAHVLYGTVVWNSEIDFDPDTLYLEGTLSD